MGGASLRALIAMLIMPPSEAPTKASGEPSV